MSQLTSVLTQSQQEYRPSIWAVLLHQIPHVNITFHRIHDDRFRPESELYLESLGIIGSVPAAWLIFTLILLLIYLLTRCCDTKNNKKRKSRPVRCCLSFFALLCCAALGAGFWGNHIFHEEANRFTQDTGKMSRLIEHAQNQAKKFNDVLSMHVRGNLNTLYDGPFRDTQPYQDKAKHQNLIDLSDNILGNISHGLTAMDKVRLRLLDKDDKPITIGHVPLSVEKMERVRWPATMSLLGVCSVFCLLLFIGAIVHSRGILILFSVCGLFSIILLWLLAALYITVAVAVADFCTDPNPWVEWNLASTYNLSADISDYYLRCSPAKPGPFQPGLQEAQKAVMDIDAYVKRLNIISKSLYSDTTLNPELSQLIQASQQTINIMGELNNSLNCDQIHRLYNGALVSTCESGLLGLVIMLVSAAVCALVFTLLVWCNSHTWIYFKHKGKYVKVEDQDPYMPLSTIDRGRGGQLGGPGPPTYQRSRTIHTPPQTPPYHGTLNGHGGFPGGPGGGPPMGKNGGHAMTLDHNKLPTAPPTVHAGVGYGHIGTLNRGMGGHPQQAGFMNPGHATTLGRPSARPQLQQQHPNATYGSVQPQGGAGPGGPGSNSWATMTLGRKGHYASLRGSRPQDNDLPMLGPNQGQYATLSKGCKTLESSDFY